MAGLKITGVDLKRELIQVENGGHVAVSLEGKNWLIKIQKTYLHFQKALNLTPKKS